MKCGPVGLMILLTGSAQAGWFGPSTYQECVLENMKGVTSDLAAKSIAWACHSQFPLPPISPSPKPLPANPTEAEIRNYEIQRAECIRSDQKREWEYKARGGSDAYYVKANCGDAPPSR